MLCRDVLAWHGYHGSDDYDMAWNADILVIRNVAWHGIALEWLVAWDAMHGRAFGMARDNGHGTYGMYDMYGIYCMSGMYRMHVCN